MEPIAIIGIGCRFPGAKNPEAYWQLLRNGVGAISEVPPDRWDVDAFYDPDLAAPGKMNTRWGGFIDQVDQFDPYFFGIAPREAMSMDPQQRLLLEVAWEALEDAGQVVDALANTSVGVFVGISSNDYSQQVRDPRLIDTYIGTGNLFSIAAGRISYLLNLRGPSLAVDTACSSSLLSLHLACQSLQRGESSLALAGGVNLILSPGSTITLSKLSALSPDGRCKTFDASANGYVRGEGAGMVVLKKLSDALADNDPIYAVVRGSAINHDGRSNGLTAPNGPSQEELIRRALADADVAPTQISYVEAHGTGTPLGDPIEVMALGAVLSEGRTPNGENADSEHTGSQSSVCKMGSVKSNIGHLEAAAGVASLIKVALALKHRELPPSLHFHEPNPYIPFDQLPLRVQDRLEPWSPADGEPALAGISSFGFSGTNAHVILEEAPAQPTQTSVDRYATATKAQVLTLSARSPDALRTQARTYRDMLVMRGPNAPVSLTDICYTASVRRTHHDQRLAIVFHDWDELVDRLSTFLQDEVTTGVAAGRKHLNRRPRLAFVFSGQGPQWWAMGRALLEQEPVFRAALERIDGLLQSETDAEWSLLAELTADEANSRLDQTEIAQPALFALQVALTELWQSWGVTPAAVVGHSMGEVAAAHVAGSLRLADAVRVIYQRGRLMQRATGLGKMATMDMAPADVEAWLDGYGDRLAVAAINGPTSTVVAGEAAAVDELVHALEEEQIFVRLLPVNYAFHSPQMDPFLSELEAALQHIQPQAATLPLFSTVTGQALNGAPLDAAYWRRNMREPVRFAAAIDALVDKGYTCFVEVGPHPVLAGAIAQCLHQRDKAGTILPSLRRQEPERATLLSTLGTLYTLGYPVDWRRLHPDGGRCVPLPAYPWQRERYWLETTPEQPAQTPGHPAPGHRNGQGAAEEAAHPLLGPALPTLAHLPTHHTWQQMLDGPTPAYLADHRVRGWPVLPAAAYIEMALAAAAAQWGDTPITLRDVTFDEALFVADNQPRLLQVSLAPAAEASDEQTHAVQIHSGAPYTQSPAWALHARGEAMPNPDAESRAPVDLADLRARCAEDVPVADFYAALHARGLEYGPLFQGVRQVGRGAGEALGRIQLAETLLPTAGLYRAHPALLDACLQVLGASVSPEQAQALAQQVFIPVGLDRLCIYGPLPPQLWSHARLHTPPEHEPDTLAGDVRLLDEAGTIVAEIEGFRFQRLGRAMQAAIQTLQESVGAPAADGSETASNGAGPQAQRAPANSTAAAPASPGTRRSGAMRQTLQAAAPDAREPLLADYLGEQIAKAMKTPVSKLDFHQPLEDQGFDSLMAIEVKYAVESELSVEIPVRNLIEKPTVVSLAAQLNDLWIEQTELTAA